jgi:hypothetical protein
LQHCDQILPDIILIDRDKRFALFSDQLQKAAILSASQHRGVINCRFVQLLVVVQKTINNMSIVFEDFLRLPS